MDGLEGKEDVSQKLKDSISCAIGEGISIIDEDLRISWVNPIIEQWAGKLEEIKGKNCYKVYQKSAAPCENCPSVKTFKTGKIEEAIQRAYDSQGNVKYFKFTSSPIIDKKGKITAVTELAVDLTGEIELKHKLKEIKESLLSIFDGIEDGISVVDNNYRISRANHEILKLFNKRNFQDLLGKECFKAYFKDDKPCDDCPAQKTFKEGKPYHVIKIYYGIDKGRAVLDFFTFPIKDNNGKVIQVIEYIKNVSVTVKLEDQLLYQERLAGIGKLASGIAHEIRNPLGIIIGSSQFCLSKYKLTQSVKKHLQIILRNSENANRIIKDLLDFAKHREISFKVGSIKEVIDSVCNLVRTRCAEQGVRLTRRWSRRLPAILLDKKRLEEAFLNIILNALDAMPNGGRLIINAIPNYQTNEIIVSFLDTGCGIAPEDLNKMFTPFFTTKEEGVGLGLCLSYQIIDYHKGSIKIESKVGEGTEVIVSFPFSREN